MTGLAQQAVQFFNSQITYSRYGTYKTFHCDDRSRCSHSMLILKFDYISYLIVHIDTTEAIYQLHIVSINLSLLIKILFVLNPCQCDSQM